MSSPSARSLLGLSLLHITQDQAAGVVLLDGLSPHGLLIKGGWQRRLPVIVDITQVESTLHVVSADLAAFDQLLLSRCRTAWPAQKQLKAFGNRMAARARKPLRIERVAGRGLVHLAPANHHLAACGLLLDGAAIKSAATCPRCILLALTPPPLDRDCDYHPGGRVYVSDAELRLLRDHVCSPMSTSA